MPFETKCPYMVNIAKIVPEQQLFDYEGDHVFL